MNIGPSKKGLQIEDISRVQYSGIKLNISDQVINNQIMRVQKRNNRGFEEVRFDKITDRIRNLCVGLNPTVSPTMIALQTIKNLYDGISTEQLDKISAKIAESYKLVHPDYSNLAAKLLISNLHKTTPKSFSECMGQMITGRSAVHHDFIMQNGAQLDNMIIHENDYLFDYFGYKTLEYSYLNKVSEPALNEHGIPIYIAPDGKVVPGDQVEFGERENPIMRKPYELLAKETPFGTIYLDDRNREYRPEQVKFIDGVAVGDTHRVVPLGIKMIDHIVDRPQYMFMRVAICININSNTDVRIVLENIKHCYKLLSQLYFTHATPTLFNACTSQQQINSCFLLGTDDNIEDIMDNLKKASLISKGAGGIGIHMSNIRSRNQVIKSTNGKSSGLVRQLKMYNDAACTWDQGGRRKGAFAIYIEPWHGDILGFLRMKLNQGSDSERARDLFYALWVPDLFVYCAEKGFTWSLFSEDTAPGLSDVYDGMRVCTKCNYCANSAYSKFITGDSSAVINGTAAVPTVEQSACSHNYELNRAFTELYTRYENMGLAVGTLNAREIMDAIGLMQRESGTPYTCFKDHVNRMSNQMAIGTIKSSNLCTEIMEWSSKDSYACCTLASINLKKFLVKVDNAWTIDHIKLHTVVMLIARNLDIIIDENDYPVIECEDNSRKYRPIGIGVQALADVFAIMRIPFLSTEAAKHDLEIFETIYHAAITASWNRSKELGSFDGFEHSPAASGILAPDLWLENQKYINSPLKNTKLFSGRYDFNELKKNVSMYGLRNSLHIAPMPTVSTSQILGNNESFEPFASNISVKDTLGGKFTVSNKYMIHHLIELGLWSDQMRIQVSNNEGSIQSIAGIPDHVKQIYLTTWELKQVDIMNRAGIRQAFVDQAQSLNIHAASNSDAVLRGVFFHGWKIGLKTGSYYVRTKASGAAMKNNIAVVKKLEAEEAVCTLEEGCTSCGS